MYIMFKSTSTSKPLTSASWYKKDQDDESSVDSVEEEIKNDKTKHSLTGDGVTSEYQIIMPSHKGMIIPESEEKALIRYYIKERGFNKKEATKTVNDILNAKYNLQKSRKGEKSRKGGKIRKRVKKSKSSRRTKRNK